MKKYDVVVVGGGPAGLMAAGSAAKRGCSVLLLEKMEQCGKKLCITGKGRCNLTNVKVWDDFSHHIYPKPDFLRPSFWGFSNNAVIDFFRKIGIETITERGDRVFPMCQNAVMVRDALVKWANGEGVEIINGAQVVALTSVEQQIKSVKYISYHKEKSVECETLVLATGGYSFPSTGSSGEGYLLANDMGHTIVPCFPSLTGLLPKDYDTRLQGITLSNVQLSLKIDEIIEQEVFGEVIFTDLGFEGSLGYRLSRKVVTAMNHGHKPSLVLNLKAAIPLPELRSRLQNDYLKYTSESLSLFMRHYLPRELILPFLDAMRLKSNQLICKLLPENTETLLKGLTCWVFPIERYAGYERAIVTAGGVSIEEIQKKDMRSKIIDNLFFAGEIIDLDGDTGGYNLQIAFSTGVMAGLGAAKSAHRKT